MFNKFGLSVGLISFFIGVLILALFFITEDYDFALFGYIYLVVAILINLLTVIYLLVDVIRIKSNLKKNFLTIALMLLNIPIAFLCAFIALSHKF